MRLKCPNSNDFLFLGLTQYGSSSRPQQANSQQCVINENDCLVTVDYLASECNGLNFCDIQLEAQFLHTCKNLSDYLSIAYECIPGSKRVDICSNEETFIIDSSAKSELNSRFGSFYLSSPNYPMEYTSNLNNCSCRLEYVEIDTEPTVESNRNQMNLALKAYEFDLEEGDASKCNKDMLKVDSSSHSLNLCGQHKDFKQFFTKGEQIRFNFSTDDVITRRGFLIEVTPVHETICPYGTQRFDDTKCIKFYDNAYLSHVEATTACQRQSGRLLQVKDFVDNLKLNSFIRDKLAGVVSDSDMFLDSGLLGQPFGVWSNFMGDAKSQKLNFLNLKKRAATTGAACVARRANYWMEESCLKKLPYICEFNALNVRAQPVGELSTVRNRLIRVSCGKLITKFAAEEQELSTHSPTIVRNIPEPSKKPSVLLWSSLINKGSASPNVVTTTTIRSTSSVSNILFNAIVTKEDSIQEDKKLALNNQELVMLIAVISGAAVVFIIINIFCIWNYYNKKLRVYMEKRGVADMSSHYRTSTMRRGQQLSGTSSNNRSMSTVDSYVKVAPFYAGAEACVGLLGNNELGSSSTTTTTSAGSGSVSPNNELKLDLLRNYFKNKKLEQLNFYETISSRHYASSLLSSAGGEQTCANKECLCHVDQQQRLVNCIGSTNQFPINSALQLLLQQQLSEHQSFNEVSPTQSMNSNRPLITFLNTVNAVPDSSSNQPYAV